MFELGNAPEITISVIPDGSSLSVIEASSNVELRSTAASYNKRPQVTSPRLSGLMTRTLGTSKFRDNCFISIVHPFLEAYDNGFVIDESLQLQQEPFLHCTAPVLVGRVGAAQDQPLVPRSEDIFLHGQQLVEVTHQRLLELDDELAGADALRPVDVRCHRHLDVVEDVKGDQWRTVAAHDAAHRVAVAGLAGRAADDQLAVVVLEVAERALNVRVRDRLVAAAVDDAVAHDGSDAVEFWASELWPPQFVEFGITGQHRPEDFTHRS